MFTERWVLSAEHPVSVLFGQRAPLWGKAISSTPSALVPKGSPNSPHHVLGWGLGHQLKRRTVTHDQIRGDLSETEAGLGDFISPA